MLCLCYLELGLGPGRARPARPSRASCRVGSKFLGTVSTLCHVCWHESFTKSKHGSKLILFFRSFQISRALIIFFRPTGHPPCQGRRRLEPWLSRQTKPSSTDLPLPRVGPSFVLHGGSWCKSPKCQPRVPCASTINEGGVGEGGSNKDTQQVAHSLLLSP